MRHTNEERVEVHTGRGTAEIILGCACGADGKESAHQIESGDRRVSVTRRRSNIHTTHINSFCTNKQPDSSKRGIQEAGLRE